MVREGHFEVVEVEIQTDQDHADGGVKDARIASRDRFVVFRRHVSSELWVGAADVRDVFGVEFLLDARLADDEDGTFCGGEFGVGLGQDAGDVDGGAVRGAEDFFNGGGNAHGCEFVPVVGARLGGVVGYEDDGFGLGAEEFEGFDGVRKEGVAGPKNAWVIWRSQLVLK